MSHLINLLVYCRLPHQHNTGDKQNGLTQYYTKQEEILQLLAQDPNEAFKSLWQNALNTLRYQYI